MRLSRSVRDESREVTPSADETGVSKTHELQSIQAAREGAEPRMYIDRAQENTDVDLKQLLGFLRRDEKLEIAETNRDIMTELNEHSEISTREDEVDQGSGVRNLSPSEGYSCRQASSGTKHRSRIRTGFDNGRQRWSAWGLRQQNYDRASS